MDHFCRFEPRVLHAIEQALAGAEQNRDDVEHKLFDRLPDHTWVYPGHGRDTTVGAERPSLPEWRERGW